MFDLVYLSILSVLTLWNMLILLTLCAAAGLNIKGELVLQHEMNIVFIEESFHLKGPLQVSTEAAISE